MTSSTRRNKAGGTPEEPSRGSPTTRARCRPTTLPRYRGARWYWPWALEKPDTFKWLSVETTWPSPSLVQVQQSTTLDALHMLPRTPRDLALALSQRSCDFSLTTPMTEAMVGLFQAEQVDDDD